MLQKLVHYFVLLCYINILAYEAGANTSMAHDDSILNGESILEFVLDDVLDIPIDKEAEDVEILYEEYRSIQHQYYLMPLFVLVLGLLFAIRPLLKVRKHPVYDGKKRQIIPDYYSHLYRLKPF
ncbi:hypothetical protein [Sphingobacterium wenxiniae]|uniref:Uncharacterized protein n=1 Tax=Sphingobacterium wenxiniae TaxID=683125 RepID=A0A1I6R9D5_9SPHI|nr:hypothetical protein [Sphingobacterium wenxiniae]SFS61329.1 hypothetical protein SAMN05660206_103230 [Sphingobacterium wenxiniae]